MVKFNVTSASFTVSSDARITATVPNGATTGPISVTNPKGTASSVDPVKHVRSITLSGPRGAWVSRLGARP